MADAQGMSRGNDVLYRTTQGTKEKGRTHAAFVQRGGELYSATSTASVGSGRSTSST